MEPPLLRLVAALPLEPLPPTKIGKPNITELGKKTTPSSDRICYSCTEANLYSHKLFYSFWEFSWTQSPLCDYFDQFMRQQPSRVWAPWSWALDSSWVKGPQKCTSSIQMPANGFGAIVSQACPPLGTVLCQAGGLTRSQTGHKRPKELATTFPTMHLSHPGHMGWN